MSLLLERQFQVSKLTGEQEFREKIVLENRDQLSVDEAERLTENLAIGLLDSFMLIYHKIAFQLLQGVFVDVFSTKRAATVHAVHIRKVSLPQDAGPELFTLDEVRKSFIAEEIHPQIDVVLMETPEHERLEGIRDDGITEDVVDGQVRGSFLSWMEQVLLFLWGEPARVAWTLSSSILAE